MIKECPFLRNGKCSLWVDYRIMQEALQEATELSTSNWNEINYLLDRVKLLEALLNDNDINIPE